MANVRISGLPRAASLTSDDVIPVVQDGATKQVSVDQLRARVGALSRFGAAVRNVHVDFGAAGDGIKDDTAALQRAFDGLSETAVRTVYLPRGTYRITAPIKIPFVPGLRIVGDGGEQMTRILQHTAGQAVLWFSRSLTHDVYVADLTLAYPAPQTRPDSNAVLYRDETTPDGTWFKHIFERVTVLNAYRGWKLDSRTGAPTCWNFRWRDCRLKAITGSVIAMRGAKPNGQPVSAIENMLVENTNTKVTSKEPAFDLGPNEFVVDQLDIEGWAHDVFLMDAGGFLTIRGLHVEQHRFIRPQARIFALTNAGLTLDGFSIGGTATASNTDLLALFYLIAAAPAHIENGNVAIVAGASRAPIREVVWRDRKDATLPPIQWFNVVALAQNTANLPGTGPNAAITMQSLATHGLMPDGRRGTQLPAGAPLYLYSPNGTRFRVSVTDAGALQVDRG